MVYKIYFSDILFVISYHRIHSDLKDLNKNSFLFVPLFLSPENKTQGIAHASSLPVDCNQAPFPDLLILYGRVHSGMNF